MLLFGTAACGFVDIHVLHVDVLAAPQGEIGQAGADRVVRMAVYQDKPASIGILGVRIEGNRPVQIYVAYPDLVQLKLARGNVLERIYIDLVLDRSHAGGNAAVANLHDVGSAGKQGLDRKSVV